MRYNLKLDPPGGERKVLLHTCCAPCSSAIVECMLKEGLIPVVYYSNPNIFPYGEYARRRDECARYADSLGIGMVEDEYDHETWLKSVCGLENEPERGGRCLKCFEMRLGRAAEFASAHGFKVLTTTLASSRWKSLDQINTAGEAACREQSLKAPDHPVVWWSRNWRKGGLQERRGEIIREMNFYNQLYCGCEYSMRNQKEL